MNEKKKKIDVDNVIAEREGERATFLIVTIPLTILEIYFILQGSLTLKFVAMFVGIMWSALIVFTITSLKITGICPKCRGITYRLTDALSAPQKFYCPNCQRYGD